MPAPQGLPGPPLAAKGAVTTPPQRSGEWKEGGNSMLALKYLLMILGAALFGSATALVAYDILLSEQLRRLLSRGKTDEPGAEVGALARRPFRPVRWWIPSRSTIHASRCTRRRRPKIQSKRVMC